MKDKKKTSIEEVFEELSKLSNEEFWDEVDAHKDTLRAKAIFYAFNSTIDAVDVNRYAAYRYDRDGKIYYFARIEHFDMAMKSTPQESALMDFADAVLDTRTNKVLKSRFLIETVFDIFYLNKENLY